MSETANNASRGSGRSSGHRSRRLQPGGGGPRGRERTRNEPDERPASTRCTLGCVRVCVLGGSASRRLRTSSTIESDHAEPSVYCKKEHATRELRPGGGRFFADRRERNTSHQGERTALPARLVLRLTGGYFKRIRRLVCGQRRGGEPNRSCALRPLATCCAESRGDVPAGLSDDPASGMRSEMRWRRMGLARRVADRRCRMLDSPYRVPSHAMAASLAGCWGGREPLTGRPIRAPVKKEAVAAQRSQPSPVQLG